MNDQRKADPLYTLAGFVPCVPFRGPDGDIEEGVLELGSRRMEGVTLELLPDETLIVDSPGRRQTFPKGLASLIFVRNKGGATR